VAVMWQPFDVKIVGSSTWDFSSATPVQAPRTRQVTSPMIPENTLREFGGAALGKSLRWWRAERRERLQAAPFGGGASGSGPGIVGDMALGKGSPRVDVQRPEVKRKSREWIAAWSALGGLIDLTGATGLAPLPRLTYRGSRPLKSSGLAGDSRRLRKEAARAWTSEVAEVGRGYSAKGIR
jgi:hypothetical protein